jgi:hypothetical protein
VGLDQKNYALTNGKPGKALQLSPAALLYAIDCQTLDCTLSQEGSLPQDWPAAFKEPVNVQWGIGSPDKFTSETLDMLTAGKLSSYCRPSSSSLGLAPLRLLRGIFAGIHPRREPKPNCSYAHALPATDLDREGVGGPLVDKAISKKLILFGGHLQASNDWVDTPFSNKVPGIDYHAMALDNLIEKRHRYIREAPKISSWLDLNTGKLIEIILVFWMAFDLNIVRITSNELRHGSSARGMREGSRRWRLVLLWLGLASLGLIPILAIVAMLAYSPLNWVGLLIAALPWFPEGAAEWVERLLDKSGILHRVWPAGEVAAQHAFVDATWSGDCRAAARPAEPPPPAPELQDTPKEDV